MAGGVVVGVTDVVGVKVGEGDGVRVDVTLAPVEGVCVCVAVLDGVNEGVTDGLCDGVGDTVGVGVSGKQAVSVTLPAAPAVVLPPT